MRLYFALLFIARSCVTLLMIEPLVVTKILSLIPLNIFGTQLLILLTTHSRYELCKEFFKESSNHNQLPLGICLKTKKVNYQFVKYFKCMSTEQLIGL